MRAKRENHLAGSTIFGFYLAGQRATGPVESGSELARTHSRWHNLSAAIRNFCAPLAMRKRAALCDSRWLFPAILLLLLLWLLPLLLLETIVVVCNCCNFMATARANEANCFSANLLPICWPFCHFLAPKTRMLSTL